MSRTFPNNLINAVKIMECNLCHVNLEADQMSKHLEKHYENNEKLKVTRNREIDKKEIDSKTLRCQNNNLESPIVDFLKMVKHNVTSRRYIICGVNGCNVKVTSVKKLNLHKKQTHSY